VISVLLFCSCKAEEKKTSYKVTVIEEEIIHDVYVCPMECDTGMNYYLEGKCDICHINLIKQE
tara:strand:+ start:4983 stop:5171 length:189 start_codon:yes stop_codon:yes gene_type:complete